MIPLNPQIAEVLRLYAQARGAAVGQAPFFRSRLGSALSRTTIKGQRVTVKRER